jgi:hypothetical protein
MGDRHGVIITARALAGGTLSQCQSKDHLFVITMAKVAVGGNSNPARSYSGRHLSLVYVVELCRLPQDLPVELNNYCVSVCIVSGGARR